MPYITNLYSMIVLSICLLHSYEKIIKSNTTLNILHALINYELPEPKYFILLVDDVYNTCI